MPSSIVLVTRPEFIRGEPVFASATAVTCVVAPSDENDLARAVAEHQARHVVVGGQPYRDALYSSLAAGNVLARYGVGHDGIDKVRATNAGILCTNTPAVLDQSVAELVMLMISAAARRLLTIGAAMREGIWAPRPGVELRGKTLTIVGAGRIGRAVARIASRGYEMRVIGCRRSGTAPKAVDDAFDLETDDFHAAVREADFVSLHMPATPENRHFVNRERLAALREHAWLINTARGAVIDEAALYDALIDRTIGGAALDVFDREPYEPVDRSRDLRTLPNVILTPHVGSTTPEASLAMAERVLQNIALAEAGRFEAMDLLNPEVLDRGPGPGAEAGGRRPGAGGLRSDE
jgi:phosphoglycerate dehydrogenase-like enzyme